MARRFLDRLSFGGRVDPSVGLLLTIVVVSSLIAALSSHAGSQLFQLAALSPAAVWRGEVWRLVTWAFLEPSPLSLIFQCFALYWFGSDLANEWGSRALVGRLLTLILIVAGTLCLAAKLDDFFMAEFLLGGWGWICGMLVTWGLWFPFRVIRIYFILPVRGYWFAWLTVGLTVLFAIYAGWRAMFPEFVSEAAAFAWFYLPELPVARPKKKRAKKVAYLRVVESHDAEPPPMPEHLEKRVHELLRGDKRQGD